MSPRVGILKRTPEEAAELKALIIKRRKADPDLSPIALARRLQCSHTTVLQVLREAGLYPEPVRRRSA